MVHVGIDLHKYVSQIARLEESGELTQTRLNNDREEIRRFFEAIPAPAKVAIEASGTWWWIVDLLEELGHQPILSNPKQTKAIAAARLKNDRVDAERLAVLLRGDLLPTVWIPPSEIRQARELLRHRVQLVWTHRNQESASGIVSTTKHTSSSQQQMDHCRRPKRNPGARVGTSPWCHP